MTDDDIRFPCQVDGFIEEEVRRRLVTDPGAQCAIKTYKILMRGDIENKMTRGDLDAIENIICERTKELTKELVYFYYSREEQND